MEKAEMDAGNGAEERSAEAVITVTRTSPEDVQQRQIIVKLDGERVGELMYGETMTIPAKPGQHRLTVDNTWNRKTVELHIGAGEQVKFHTKSEAGRWTWFLVSMLGAGPIYVSIEREDGKQSQTDAGGSET